MTTRPAPRRRSRARGLPLEAGFQQGGTDPAVTPLHRSALVIHSLSMAFWRLALVMGSGCRNSELMLIFLAGVVNWTAPATLSRAVPAHRATATVPAAAPRRRASLPTLTSWVPSATRLRAALSASCPLTGTLAA